MTVKGRAQAARDRATAARVEQTQALRPWFDVPDPLAVEPFSTASRSLCSVSSGTVSSWSWGRSETCDMATSLWPQQQRDHRGHAESIPVDRLPALLFGHGGISLAQFLGDRLIDVNPRDYGWLPLAVAAGANLPAWWP